MSTRPLRRAALLAVLPLLLGLVVVAPVSAAPVELIAELSGAAEVPGPGDEDGAGFTGLVVDPEAGTICPGFIDFQDIAEPTAAHIHEGVEGVAGPPVVDLFSAPNPEGFIDVCLDSLDAALLADIVANPGNYYVNVHTGEFPDGAIRGQLTIPPPPPECTPPDLCGSFTDGPGTAVPGAYVYGGFAADASFTLAEPWLSFVLADGFILGPPEGPGEVFVGRLDGRVFTEACGATAATIPVTPQSYLDFLTSHPNVSVTTAATATTLGGASGFMLDVVGVGTADCPEGIALVWQGNPDEGLPPEAGQYVIGDGERIRIFLLDVAGDTIFLAVSDWGEGVFDELMARAQPVLNSLVFALGGAPTPTPTAAPTSAPGLPDTASVRWVGEAPSSAWLVVALLGLVGGSAFALRRVRR